MENELKLIRLEIENIFGVKAVNLELNGNGAVLFGENQAGKSSIIDSLGWLLQLVKDGDALRNGERKGYVKADFGEITIERVIKKSGAPVYKIETANGEKLSPKELFDTFIDSITFKPAEWLDKIKKNKNEGIRELFKVAGIDLDAYDSEKKKLTEERRDIGRDVKRLEGIVAAIGMPHSNTPNEEANLADLNKELEGYRQEAEAYYSLNTKLERAGYNIEAAGKAMREKFALINELEQKLAREKEQLKIMDSAQDKLIEEKQEIGNLIRSAKDFKYEIEITIDKINNVEVINQTVRKKKEYLKAKEELEKLQDQYDDYSEKLLAKELDIKERLSESKLPEGFEIEENEIYLNKVKFDRLSMFQKLDLAMKVGMLIGKSGGRQLKLLSMDISQFDEDNKEMVLKLAKDNDYQGIFEIATSKLDKNYDTTSFLIKNGEVASV